MESISSVAFAPEVETTLQEPSSPSNGFANHHNGSVAKLPAPTQEKPKSYYQHLGYPNYLFYDPDPDNLQDYPEPAGFDPQAPLFYDPDPDNLEDYPDPVPMATVDKHCKAVIDLRQQAEDLLRNVPDVYIASDLMVYTGPREASAPDVMVCFDVPRGDRRVYRIDEDGPPPSVIFEVLSESTARSDKVDKVQLYAEMKVREYFLIDPDFKYMKGEGIKGYRLNAAGAYQLIDKQDGRFPSLELGVEIGYHEGRFGFFHPQTQSWQLHRLEALEQSKEAEQAAKDEADRAKKAEQDAMDRILDLERQLKELLLAKQ